MSFAVPMRTLERLEWPALLERLAAHARTPRGRARCAAAPDGLFAASWDEAREWLAETSEARALHDSGEILPAGGAREVAPLLARLHKGGSLAPADLLALAATGEAVAASARFLRRRAGPAPRLAELGEALPERVPFADAILAAVDPEGELRDAASPALAQARREAQGLAGEVQRRVARLLQEPDVAGALQDAYFTVRGDRYVLPVRADARGRVPGIVHDASASGTTLFIEPHALVELNNRLKQAELAVERETRRVLQQLSRAAAAAAPELDAALGVLERIDLAFARAALSAELEASEPRVDPDGSFHLDQLRHPLLARDACVPNDLRLGETFTVLVISGPNAGGKTVAMKALALAVLLARAGCHVPAAPGGWVGGVERLLADIGDEQDLRESLSTFSAHMVHLAGVLEVADARTLVCLDEVGVGTDPGEGAALAQAALEALADAGARVVATTHYNLLKEMAEVDARFANASVEFDPRTLVPTYRLRLGAPGSSSATAVAARMGVPAAVLERANALLDREDRRLDQLLSELQASRAALEHERRAAEHVRVEGEAARDAYRRKLERLQERRDELFARMRSDLEQAFEEAHAEVAGVIRELQRGGGGARERAREAAQARERLLALEAKTREAEERSRAEVPEPPRARVDWRTARPGDAVALPGGRLGRLVSLPDRRGRAVVQAGSAKLEIEAERLAAASEAKAAPAAAARPAPRVRVEMAPPEAAPGRLDLRGLRVEEALDRVNEALDQAAGAGRAALEIVHGIGTGALRRAVRELLAGSPYVARFEPGPAERGGEGVTIALLGDAG